MKNCIAIALLTIIFMPGINFAQTGQLVEGPEGKFWIISGSRLNIYDPSSETLNTQPANYLKQLSLPDGAISYVFKDKRERYWLVYHQYGLFQYDPAQKKTTQLLSGRNNISGITESSTGDIWISNENGLVTKMNGQSLDTGSTIFSWKNSIAFIICILLIAALLGFVRYTVKLKARMRLQLEEFSSQAPPEKNEYEEPDPVNPLGIKNKAEQVIVKNILYSKVNGKKFTVLITDDNDDFRSYLKEKLYLPFNIIEATNGKEGWQKTLSQHPDIVVSDIMMPGMNGIDLCRKIKDDPRTNHIPVILLTGFFSEENQLQGYATGANDYVAKPFRADILLFRIKNLLVQTEQLKQTFQRHIEIHTDDITIVSEDEKMINDARDIVQKNIDNHNFSVEDMSKALFMSRAALYKKITALTGVTPLEFIRSIRLKHAAQLLQKSRMTVSEIASEVGFNNSKYFVKHFKEEFNMLPTAYRAANRH